MRFCKYCGTEISDQEDVCPACRSKAPGEKKAPGKKTIRYGAAIGIILLLLAAAVYFLRPGTCKAAECRNKPVQGSDYCYSHKCVLSDCANRRYSYSNYCRSHYLLYDDEASAPSVHSWDLKISGVTLSTNSLYTVAEGTFTNDSSSTVRFVQIKGAFQTRSGVVVDTDWTYAVGSEGLSPGESCKWRMSVSKDPSITNCEVSIIDYDT